MKIKLYIIRPTLFIIYVFMLTSCLSKNEINNSEWVDLSNDNRSKWHTFQSDLRMKN